jgi:hypothetical protein
VHKVAFMGIDTLDKYHNFRYQGKKVLFFNSLVTRHGEFSTLPAAKQYLSLFYIEVPAMFSIQQAAYNQGPFQAGNTTALSDLTCRGMQSSMFQNSTTGLNLRQFKSVTIALTVCEEVNQYLLKKITKFYLLYRTTLLPENYLSSGLLCSEQW